MLSAPKPRAYGRVNNTDRLKIFQAKYCVVVFRAVALELRDNPFRLTYTYVSDFRSGQEYYKQVPKRGQATNSKTHVKYLPASTAVLETTKIWRNVTIRKHEAFQNREHTATHDDERRRRDETPRLGAPPPSAAARSCTNTKVNCKLWCT